MTHTTSRRATRSLGVAGVVAAMSLALVLPMSAGASQRTSSDVVAAESARALEALDAWDTTQRPVHFVRFVRTRTEIAHQLATELGLPVDTFVSEWEQADETKMVAVLAALSQLGVPYRSIAREPGVGFDCSGLTSWAYSQAGIELPRVSRDQIDEIADVAVDDLTPGDLTYYPGHVSIYIGAGMMVHAPNTGSTVTVAPVSNRTQRYGDPTSLLDAATTAP